MLNALIISALLSVTPIVTHTALPAFSQTSPTKDIPYLKILKKDLDALGDNLRKEFANAGGVVSLGEVRASPKSNFVLATFNVDVGQDASSAVYIFKWNDEAKHWEALDYFILIDLK